MNIYFPSAANVRDGEEPVPQGRVRSGNRWVWAAFGAVLILYVLSVLHVKPVAAFGVGVDDALYFCSAKALAAGKGYVLPSFPGNLPSMKYPELFPLLLAGIWKLDRHFPENVPLAVGLVVGFGCLALLFTFLMLRRWPGLGDWPALAIVFLTAVGGTFAYQSAIIGSDVPFMAAILGAAWLAEHSLANKRGTGAAFSSGLLAGMSVGVRSLGIPVAAGIGLWLMFRRKFRRLFWFCLAGLPLTLLWSWPAVTAILGESRSNTIADPLRSGWTQTVCYYSSYGCFWRTHTPNLEVLKSTAVLNLRLLSQAPGGLLLEPLIGSSLLSLILVMLLSVGAYVGIVRLAYRAGARPLHAILPFYLLVLVIYPFNPDRFLLPFAPMFFAGLWLEARQIGGLIAGRVKQGCDRDERAVAGILALGMLTLAAIVVVNYGYTLPRIIGGLAVEHAMILADEQASFKWLRHRASPGARVIAYEDGLTYLYSGRTSVRPIFCISEAYYLTDAHLIQRDAARLADVAEHIGASYWMTTPYDYPLQTPVNRALLRNEEQHLLATAPVVYRSPDGQVVLYDTRCLWNAVADGCDLTAPKVRSRRDLAQP